MLGRVELVRLTYKLTGNCCNLEQLLTLIKSIFWGKTKIKLTEHKSKKKEKPESRFPRFVLLIQEPVLDNIHALTYCAQRPLAKRTNP